MPPQTPTAQQLIDEIDPVLTLNSTNTDVKVYVPGADDDLPAMLELLNKLSALLEALDPFIGRLADRDWGQNGPLVSDYIQSFMLVDPEHRFSTRPIILCMHFDQQIGQFQADALALTLIIGLNESDKVKPAEALLLGALEVLTKVITQADS